MARGRGARGGQGRTQTIARAPWVPSQTRTRSDVHSRPVPRLPRPRQAFRPRPRRPPTAPPGLLRARAARDPVVGRGPTRRRRSPRRATLAPARTRSQPAPRPRGAPGAPGRSPEPLAGPPPPGRARERLGAAGSSTGGGERGGVTWRHPHPCRAWVAPRAGRPAAGRLGARGGAADVGGRLLPRPWVACVRAHAGASNPIGRRAAGAGAGALPPPPGPRSTGPSRAPRSRPERPPRPAPRRAPTPRPACGRGRAARRPRRRPASGRDARGSAPGFGRELQTNTFPFTGKVVDRGSDPRKQTLPHVCRRR